MNTFWEVVTFPFSLPSILTKLRNDVEYDLQRRNQTLMILIMGILFFIYFSRKHIKRLVNKYL